MTKPDNLTTLMPCPNCKKLCQLGAQNPNRPFCSKQCRDSDLHGWFNEINHIPGKTISGSMEEDEQDKD